MGQHHVFFLVLLLSGCSFAGPVRDAAAEGSEMTEDDVCILKNETFARGDVVPDVAPCETCVCEPPEVKCSMVKCHHNNGCKIIQQLGKCCPVYKCDCEHEGKTYNNGEKLENPVLPCQVCYCRGGEIMCNSITCYRRDDCEPQIIEGQCCPKYGHCPSKNSSSVIAVPADPTGLSTKREMQPWLLTKSVNVPTSETSKYPQTINIVEILPTQAPARSGEVSQGPRIITNGSPDKLASFSKPPTDNPSSTETSAQPLMMSPELSTNGVDEVAQPDSETFSTTLPHLFHVTTEYEGLAAFSGEATEGTGYDIVSGGTFFPKTTQEEGDSKEESYEGSGESSEKGTTSPVTTTDDQLEERELHEQEVSDELKADNQTMRTNMEVEVTETDEDLTTVTDNLSSTFQSSETGTPDSSEEGTRAPDSLVTRHGLTIPPILNLNHQLHHLTLGGTGDGREETSVVRIGVYDPTKPGEVSNMVTVIKNEDTVPMTSLDDSATTQVLLTPEDLKTLAEMIIKERIIKAPNENLQLGSSATTPLPTELYEETSAASSILLETKENTTSTTLRDGKAEETTTPSPKAMSDRKIHNLTKEEEKAQAALDKLTSNIHIPLQGIELVDSNETTTVYPDVHVLPSNVTSLLESKDAEWVDISNSTSKADRVEDETSTVSDITEGVDDITEEDNRTTAGDNGEFTTQSTSEELTSIAVPGKQRGSLRQMENRPVNSQELGDRRTRITASSDPSELVSTAMLDENDKLLVENFFKKALDFQ